MTVCRNAACNTSLDQPLWGFCPVCGTSTGEIETASDLTALIPPAGQSLETSVDYSVRIPKRGPRTVRMSVDWIDPPERFVPLPARADDSACDLRFRLEPGFVSRPCLLRAVIVSRDGPRESRWVPARERRRGVVVRLVPQSPARLVSVEEALVLAWDRSVNTHAPPPVREVHLRNEGGRTVELQTVEIPAGVGITDQENRSVDQLSHGDWELGPGQETRLYVTLDGTSLPSRCTAHLFPSEGEPVDLTLLIGGQTHSGFQPRFVVGVDFGTENTSVYCRDLSDGSVFPVPLDDVATRMPCYMAFNDARCEEPTAYGKAAVDWLVLGRGIVVRNLKVHLRHGRQPYIEKFGNAFRTENLLFYFLNHLKESVEQFLENRAGAIASTIWSFTLPVLTETSAYDTLRRKYSAVLRRAFHREITDGLLNPDDTFAFTSEPEAAALYIFQRLGADVPTLLPRPFADGDVVCVLDAGAGTTDIALMRMRIREGQQTFEMLGEVGTDLPGDGRHPEDFGGRSADLALVECLARGSLKGASVSTSNVNRQVDLLLGEGTDDPAAARERALQAAMEAKHRLCSAGRSDPSRTIDVRDSAWPDLDRTIPGEVALPRFHATIAPSLDRILERLQSLVDQCGLTRRDVGWVFAIGGSSNIPLVEQRLETLFPGRVISLENYRDVRLEAVARGAVWSWRARLSNIVTLDVTLQIRQNGTDFRRPVLFRDRPMPWRPQEFRFELMGEATVELVGTHPDGHWRLTRLRAQSPHPTTLTVTVNADQGALHLRACTPENTWTAPPAWLV